jgi:histone H4
MSGKGIRGSKRHQRQQKDNIRGITKGAIKRLAARAGVMRIKSDVYEKTRNHLKNYLEDFLKGVVVRANYAQRKTIFTKDVVEEYKRRGRALYGSQSLKKPTTKNQHQQQPKK